MNVNGKESNGNVTADFSFSFEDSISEGIKEEGGRAMLNRRSDKKESR